MWSVGQKVICINDAFHPAVWDWCDRIPTAGHIYTIRSIRRAPAYVTRVRGVGFLLEELRNPRKPSGAEASFCQTRFVPLAEVTVEMEVAAMAAASSGQAG